jgi:hypothetical protein
MAAIADGRLPPLDRDSSDGGGARPPATAGRAEEVDDDADGRSPTHARRVPAAATDDAEEARLLQRLDEEKAVYTRAFAQLRSAKAEVEGLQRLIAAGKAKVDADFEAWYAALPASTTTRAEAPAAATAAAAAGEPLLAPSVASTDEEKRPPPATATIAPTAALELTGIPEVDADIIAFQRAKEELMRRRAAATTRAS